MKRAAILLFTLLLSASVCSAHKPGATPVASTPTAEPEPVIVRLVSRDKTITIFAGPGHALYSATDSEGRTIVSKATLDELKTSHPKLYQRVSPDVTAYAGL